MAVRVAITDDTGNLVQRASQPYGYTGQPADPLGLVDLRARVYAPALGRFLQRDRAAGNLADPLSLNRSTYARNNPTSLTDPSGLTPLNKALQDIVDKNDCNKNPLQVRCLGVLARTITGASVYIPGPGDPTIEAGIRAALGEGGSGGTRPSQRLIGEQPPTPTDLGGFRTLAQLGRALNWGSKEDPAIAAQRGAQVTREQLAQLGNPPGSVSASTIQTWRDFYSAVSAWDPGNVTAPGRAAYLGAILQTLSGP